MADSKISELTALTTPASDDVLAIVDTSAGVTKKITISNLSTSSEVVDDTSPQLGGDLASNGNDILFADNDKAKFGTGNDLEIYHDGSNSYIDEVGTGDLYIKANNEVRIQGQDGVNLFYGQQDGSTALYYDGTSRIQTTPTGGNINGSLTADGLTVDDITIDGSTISDSGDLTLDIGGDIILDAGGNEIKLKDSGTQVGFISMASEHLTLKSEISNKDMIFKGNDGGSEVTALTLDMSNAGRANFNNDIGINDNRGVRFGNDDDSVIFNDNSHFYIKNGTLNQDIIFQGNDDGSSITALTLDMSAAGHATFNNQITATNGNFGSSVNTQGVLNLSNGGAEQIEFFTGASSGVSQIQAFNRNDSSYDNLEIIALDFKVKISGTEKFNIASNGTTTITTSDNTAQLTLTSTDTDANSGPRLDFIRNPGEAGADADFLSAILHRGYNDATELTTFAEMNVQIVDASNGSEDGRFYINTMVAGTAATSRMELTPTETVFNEGSANLDFRVESNGATHMLFVDGGNNGVFVNTDNSAGNLDGASFGVQGGVTFLQTGNSDNLTLLTTDADANSGPNLRMYRNSSSPADADTIGVVEFEGRNDNSQDVIYSQMRTVVNDVSDGTEDGQIDIKIMNGGSLNMVASFKGPETVINDASIDHDFRVESNGNTHMLFVDGGNDKVGIGTSSPSSNLHIVSGGSTGTLNSDADELVVQGTRGGLSILSNNGEPNTIAFGDVSDADVGKLIYDHGSNTMTFSTNTSEKFRILSGGQISTGGEDNPDPGSGGLCLQQGAIDSAIMTFKSSDVNHGMTGKAETDTYAAFQKFNVGEGGLGITGFSESGSPGLNLAGFITSATTSEAVGSEAAVMVNTALRNGTTIQDFGADDNLFAVRMNSDTRFIVKGDGELFSDGTATVGTYDAYDDAQLVRAFDLNHMQGVINSKFDKFVQYNKDDLQKAKLIGTDNEGNVTSMVNITGMQRLHNGAIWQQYEKTERLANAMYELAKAAVGEKKANEILEQNEIKLLN